MQNVLLLLTSIIMMPQSQYFYTKTSLQIVYFIDYEVILCMVHVSKQLYKKRDQMLKGIHLQESKCLKPH